MYYPKYKIKENLYTLGKEYSLFNTNEEYVGYYYELYNGEKYTGKNPNEGPSKLLKQYVIPNTQLNVVYDNIPKNIPNVKIFKNIQTYHPILGNDDYNKGYIIRYFCKKFNNISVFEISKETFEDILNKQGNYDHILYQITSLNWVIKGKLEDSYENNILIPGVVTINKNTVSTKENTFKGIQLYLKDFKEFFI